MKPQSNINPNESWLKRVQLKFVALLNELRADNDPIPDEQAQAQILNGLTELSKKLSEEVSIPAMAATGHTVELGWESKYGNEKVHAFMDGRSTVIQWFAIDSNERLPRSLSETNALAELYSLNRKLATK
jgi:hypothetical protein